MAADKKGNAGLRELLMQIEELYGHFKEIRAEAAGIVETSNMPDAALHLQDVLQSTEEATSTIIDAVGVIGDASNGLPEEYAAAKEIISDEVTRILVACSFQDISGQRINKVLRHMNTLEEKLANLSRAARKQAKEVAEDEEKKKAPGESERLLNGPALATEAPSQADIDALFNQL